MSKYTERSHDDTQPPLSVNEVAAVTNDPRGLLYQGILSPDIVAKPGPSISGDEIIFDVFNDTALEYAGRPITLHNHRLFALNALLATRQPSTRAQLRSLGFDPQATGKDFSRALESVRSCLHQATGHEVVGKLSRGRDSLFILSPNVVISDHRLETGDGTEAHPWPGIETDLKSNSGLDRAFSAILDKYRNHPTVAKRIAAYKIKNTPMSTDKDDIGIFRDIAYQFPLLTAGQEPELFQILQSGLAIFEANPDMKSLGAQEEQALIDFAVAEQQINLSNLRLVASIAATRFGFNTMPAIDLIQEGCIGLHKAIVRFDFTLGNKFSTFATWWIRQGVDRAIANQARLIRMPVDAHGRWLGLLKHESNLSDILQRDPTAAELAHASGLAPDKIVLLRLLGRYHLDSLDLPIGDGNMDYSHKVRDPEDVMEVLPSQISDKVEVGYIFASDRLLDREKLVLGMRTGAFDCIPRDLDIKHSSGQSVEYTNYIDNITSSYGLTLAEIGKLLGIVGESVRQIELKAHEKARRVIAKRRLRADPPGR